MTIRFRGIIDPNWISFKYESLPNFCYFCGLVDHTYNKCTKYLLRCDNFSIPPALEYKETLRATTFAQHKRNPFELSNSIPYEEYFPRTRTDDQSLQQAVDQFLRVDTPVLHPASHPAAVTVGKTIVVSPPSPPPHSRGSIGVVISEPRPTTSPGISSGTRWPLTRQTAQVGDSVRSMLKRARAVVTEDVVVPSISDDEPMAGADTRPRREK
uniref:Zinc knuckle CX2CX4HX4C domain-containing protein n=1 Tax=Cannabis sativa TaxID=3483 RepID=A0A803QCI1_CANSA